MIEGDAFGTGKRGFSWNGKTLLSGIDPAGRSNRIAEAVPAADRTLYLCPSPLYGHGLECLLARIAPFPNSAVLCIEAETELFALSQDWGAELKNSQKLRLTDQCEAGALCALLRQEWGPRFFRRVEVVRLNGGWQLHAEVYDMLAESLRREIALDWGNAMTLARLGRRYIRNALQNLPLLPRCHSLSEVSFGNAPTLVLGAGPSLDIALNGLQSRFGDMRLPEQRPFRIICVDTCLSSLRDRGITPDMTIILESQHWNLADFTGLCGWNVPAAFDLSALPRSADILAGGLFLFFTPWTTLTIFERLQASGLLPTRLPPLGSVGLSAAAIARRITSGAIIVAGLDFSFTIDSYHARSTPGHKSRLRRQNRFTSLLNAEAAFGKAVFPAVSKAGGKVRSNPSMRNYRDLFEREFGGASAGGAAAFCAIGSGAESGGRFFDISGSGLPLGITTLSAEDAFNALSNGNKVATGKLPDAPTGNRRGGHSDDLEKKLKDFIRDEQNRLTTLKDMLTGETAADNDTLAALIDQCDYLWAHFPDYAAANRRPGKAELESGSDAIVSFLKRLRVEIDPFLKLWELILTTDH